MDVLLAVVLIPIFLLIGVIVTSNGECYYCGERLNKPIVRHKGKKHCGHCDTKS